MNCPVCKISLVMSDRNGVEIDYCPSCRGIWLDRGELDKIIERVSDHAEQHGKESYRENREGERRDHGEGHNNAGHHSKKHKKESFLGDLFEF